MAVGLACNRADAEELFAEVVGIAVERLPGDLQSSHGWFRRVLRNTWIDSERRRRRNARLMTDLAGHEVVLLESTCAREASSRRRAVEELLDALERLPLEEREVLRCVHLRELDLATAARELGISERTIQRRKKSGEARLVGLLAEPSASRAGCLAVLVQGVDWQRTLASPPPETASAGAADRGRVASWPTWGTQAALGAAAASACALLVVALDAVGGDAPSNHALEATGGPPRAELVAAVGRSTRSRRAAPASSPNPTVARAGLDAPPEVTEEFAPESAAAEAPPCTFELELLVDGEPATGWFTFEARFDGRAPLKQRRKEFKNELHGPVEQVPGLYRWSLPDARGEWRITLARDVGEKVGDQRALIALLRIVAPDSAAGGPTRERIELTTASFEVELLGPGVDHPSGSLKTFHNLAAATWLHVSPRLDSPKGRWIYQNAFEGDFRFGMRVPDGSLDPATWHVFEPTISVERGRPNVVRAESAAFLAYEHWPPPPRSSGVIKLKPGEVYRPK